MMKKKLFRGKIGVLAMLATFAFGLGTLSCDLSQGPVEIRVYNNSEANMRVTIFRFNSETEREVQRHNVNTVRPGEHVLWQDDAGSFRVRVIAPPFNTQYHFPIGGGTTRTRMEGTVRLSFDGNNVVNIR